MTSTHQPEFWKTVKEDGVYPDRVEYGSTTDLWERSYDDSRSCRFYARKMNNVQYTDSPGQQVLTYDETDIHEHVFMLDIFDQPLEGTVLLCIRVGQQLYGFGSDTRHDGGTP